MKCIIFFSILNIKIIVLNRAKSLTSYFVFINEWFISTHHSEPSEYFTLIFKSICYPIVRLSFFCLIVVFNSLFGGKYTQCAQYFLRDFERLKCKKRWWFICYCDDAAASKYQARWNERASNGQEFMSRVSFLPDFLSAGCNARM